MDSVREFVEPIKKKWIYHFIISTKTNSIERPEWYFGTTRKWIQENLEKVELKLGKPTRHQHTPTSCSGACCSQVRHLFVLSMVELIMKRLCRDMEKVSAHLLEDTHYEAILMHTYNEVISFTKFLKQTLGPVCFANLDDRYDILSVFCNEILFERIVDVEWEYAEKNLKNITNASNILDPILEGEFVDEYKIPMCADRFLLLVTSITERVECFKQLDCQFKLVELQCFLFEKFLRFLKKLSDSKPRDKSLISNFILFSDDSSTIDLSRVLHVLNSVNFLRLILKEKNFIPAELVDKLDKTLTEKSTKLAQDYKTFFYDLINRVLNIYDYVDCQPKKFYEFIEPKLSCHIFELVREEVSKLHEKRQTQSLLGSLSFG